MFQAGINCSVDACAGFALEPSMAQAKHGSEPRTTADAWLSWSLDQVHHHPILPNCTSVMLFDTCKAMPSLMLFSYL